MFTLLGEAQNRVSVRAILLQALLTNPSLSLHTACLRGHLQTMNGILYVTVPSVTFCFFISSVVASDAEMIMLVNRL